MNQVRPCYHLLHLPGGLAKTPAGTRTLGPALAAGKPTHRSVTQYRQTSVGPKGLRERQYRQTSVGPEGLRGRAVRAY